MSSSEESDNSVEIEPRTRKREVIATDPDKSKSFCSYLGSRCRIKTIEEAHSGECH